MLALEHASKHAVCCVVFIHSRTLAADTQSAHATHCHVLCASRSLLCSSVQCSSTAVSMLYAVCVHATLAQQQLAM
eukprot:15926-Heterococcus_DN1.PRE.3